MGRPNISCWNNHQNRFYVSAIVVGTVVATMFVGTAVPTKVVGTAAKEMFFLHSLLEILPPKNADVIIYNFQ